MPSMLAMSQVGHEWPGQIVSMGWVFFQVHIMDELKHTEHEVWEVDLVVSLGSVDVGEDLVVYEVDAKRIRDDDNDALGRSSLWWLGNVGVQAVELDHLALGGSIMFGAGKAGWARHFECRFWPTCDQG